MLVFLGCVGAVLIGGLMIFTAWASTVGGLAAITDSRYERCPRCGHHELVHTGPVHGDGCPVRHAHHLPVRHRS